MAEYSQAGPIKYDHLKQTQECRPLQKQTVIQPAFDLVKALQKKQHAL